MIIRDLIICLFTVLLSVAPGFSQIEWEKFYGGSEYEFASQMIELSDHNLLISGYTESYGAGNADIWILKITPEGQVIWAKTFGNDKYESASTVRELKDGSILVAGNIQSFVSDTQNIAFDVWLLKLTADGDIVWIKRFDGSRSGGVAMAVDNEENIFLAANSVQDDPKQNCQVIKCNRNGDLEWIKYFGGADRETFASFRRTSDSSLLLLMTSQSFPPKTMWLYKISPDGTTVWNKTFGGNFRYGNAADIIEIPNGTYMLSGYTGATINTSLLVLNMSTDGTVLWEKNYNQFTNSYSPMLNLLSNGNFFITAMESQGRGRQVRFIRMDDTGAVLWTDITGDTSSFSFVSSFLETSDGKFLMLGETNRVTKAADDLWLVSLTPDMYINMGGKFEYHIVNNADSTKYTYAIISAPPQMKVSSGGTLEWIPQNTDPSSELVSVVLNSGSKNDTIGFLLYVNKGRSAVINNKKPLYPVAKAQNPKVIIIMSSSGVRITAPSERYTAGIYTINGKRVISLTKLNPGELLWNLTDAAGRHIQPGKYLITVNGTGISQLTSMITILP